MKTTRSNIFKERDRKARGGMRGIQVSIAQSGGRPHANTHTGASPQGVPAYQTAIQGMHA